MPVRIVRGEIDSADVTARVVIPTTSQPPWPPFERVAETMASPRRPVPSHKHNGVEVLTYIIEGSASYAFGTASPEPLLPGSAKLLTAPTTASHTINPRMGQRVRMFSLVADLPSGAAPAVRLQSSRADATEMQPDGTVLRYLVGPPSTLTSASGLASEEIEFVQEGTSFRRVGHDYAAVIYALAGPGTVDNEALDAGEAALVDEAAGVALKGEPGFRVIFSTAPRRAKGK
jgi:quercetin 2,3-dioxygenase